MEPSPLKGDPSGIAKCPPMALESAEYPACRFVAFSRNFEHASLVTEVPDMAKLC